VCNHQHFARKGPGLLTPPIVGSRSGIWSGWPDSNRHRRVGNAQLCPLSYTHGDGRRDGIRTRAGLSPDRFAGGRLRLLGHSALAAEEGLEPPIYRLTAGRCASSATPQGPQLRSPRGRVSPARLGRAGTAGGSRTRDLLGESQACCRSTTAARFGAVGTARTCALPLRRRPLCPLSYGGRAGRSAGGTGRTRQWRRPVPPPPGGPG
jgi:hypothetical protein